jgi:hypothetical protein
VPVGDDLDRLGDAEDSLDGVDVLRPVERGLNSPSSRMNLVGSACKGTKQGNQ